eukprot:g5007.t1
MIHALKEAVRLEVPPSSKVKMAQIRVKIKGKTSEERRQNRCAWIQENPARPRFRGQTRLEEFAVSPQTSNDYQRRTLLSQGFCGALKTSTAGQVDNALADFLNTAFTEGLDLSEAQKFFAAVQALPQGMGKSGSGVAENPPGLSFHHPGRFRNVEDGLQTTALRILDKAKADVHDLGLPKWYVDLTTAPPVSPQPTIRIRSLTRGEGRKTRRTSNPQVGAQHVRTPSAALAGSPKADGSTGRSIFCGSTQQVLDDLAGTNLLKEATASEAFPGLPKYADQDYWEQRYQADMASPENHLFIGGLLGSWGLEPPGHVLELGCGHASLVPGLVEAGFAALAADFSPTAVNAAAAISRVGPREFSTFDVRRATQKPLPSLNLILV